MRLINLFLLAGLAFAQADKRPEFDVASVKPAKPSADGRLMVMIGGDPGMIRLTNVSLKDLIRQAYDLKEYQVLGPDWLSQERYDVMAKMPPDTPRAQVRLMEQSLLEERFKVAVHRETKTLPVYALVAAKGGIKLKPVAEEVDNAPGTAGPKRGGMMRMGRGHIEAEQMTFGGLADALSRMMDKPVVDMTGTKGLFQFKLDFTPDESMAGMQKMAMMGGPRGGGEAHEPAANDNAEPAPSIFVALQETLGLKLEGRKEPITVVVVDRAEKVPTEN